MDSVTSSVSVVKLRVGVLFIILFWLPFWLLQPIFCALFGINSAEGKHKLLISILIIQTILGLLGLIALGRQTLQLLRHMPRKQAFKTLWRLLIHGK